MSGRKVCKLPSAHEIKKELPLSDDLSKKVFNQQQEVREAFDINSKKKVIIMGPCSAYPDSSVIECAKKCLDLQKEVRENILIIYRVYIQKPRTTIGWKGVMFRPDPFEKNTNITEGIKYSRRMMIEVAELGLPIADEMLIPEMGLYFDDILSYHAVGARTTESQVHREYASYLDAAVGLKNPTSGDLITAVNSVISAKAPHQFPLSGYQLESDGNENAHLILRGGGGKANYEKFDDALEIMKKEKMKKPQIIIDCSHENSVDPENGNIKDPMKQLDVLEYTSNEYLYRPEFKGWMIESNLLSGKHSPKNMSELIDGLSITDACVAVDDVAPVIMAINEKLKRQRAA
ncbi:3-deoxy-7-phosphoheptulonate synthase [Candidatus Peregrinibacteria bacterium]|nr:3-deoxy-7-phosphoheptulonate synthase [Candidatus Peregrinibacteria bacterium]